MRQVKSPSVVLINKKECNIIVSLFMSFNVNIELLYHIIIHMKNEYLGVCGLIDTPILEYNFSSYKSV